MREILIGTDNADFLRILPVCRSHPQCLDYWDGNWVYSRVEFGVGGFCGSIEGDLRAEEFAEFHRQLSLLRQILKGEANFQTMERWLTIHVIGDGRGRLNFQCVILDQPGIGNTLHCGMNLDQTFLPPMLSQLAKAIQEFPVIG